MRTRYANSALRSLKSLAERTEALHERGIVNQADMTRINTELAIAVTAFGESKSNLRKATLVLAHLLNLTDVEAERLRTSDPERATTPGDAEVPALEDLIRKARHHRPDLRAHRLGLQRAQLDWLKALLEPLSQVTWRPWPNGGDETKPRPPGIAPSGSRTMVVTLPTAVRNRGALKRAAINIGQTRTELAHVEREVVLDVRKVRLDYEQSRSAVERFRHEILPQAQTERERSHNLFQEGEKP